MHDAARMCGAKSARNREPDCQGVLHPERAARQAHPQRFPLEALGDDVRGVAVGADVVHREDVRMIERPRGTCFAGNRLRAIRGAGRVREQELDRDVPPEPLVARAEHFPHPAPRRDRMVYAATRSPARTLQPSRATWRANVSSAGRERKSSGASTAWSSELTSSRTAGS